jgi:hypothetical protein
MVTFVEACLDYAPGSFLHNGQEFPLPLPYFYHYHRSDLEDYAYILERLGLLASLVDPPGSESCCFKLVHNAAEAEAFIYEKNPDTPSLQRLLASLFYCVDGLGNMTFEMGAEFPLDCYMQSVMPELCELGYATRSGQGYVWLPKLRTILEIPVWGVLGRF